MPYCVSRRLVAGPTPGTWTWGTSTTPTLGVAATPLGAGDAWGGGGADADESSVIPVWSPSIKFAFKS